ncbi:MAG: acyl-CoA dehydratase activase [Acidobacteriota bacterium]
MRLGIDLGADRLKLVCCGEHADPLYMTSREVRNQPHMALADALAELDLHTAAAAQVRVGVTGGGRGLVEGIATCHGFNEVVATAHGVRTACPDARTIIDLGGHFSKWILIGAEPGADATVVDFATNGLCAAGAGAFLTQQADRLGLSVDELGRMAGAARRGATIAGRCSVFAKSDMIHLQQKGTPVDEIAYGLCQALARTFLATIAQGRAIEPPVVLVGGGAANPGLVRAFREALRPADGVVVPPDPLYYGALGSARLAAAAPPIALAGLLQALQQRHACAAVSQTGHLSALPPLRRPAAWAAPCPEETAVPPRGRVEGILGVDVGSVSTNLVLLSSSGEVLQGIYLPTRGRPVEVLQDGLDRIRARLGERLSVLGVGVTGSGRHLAADLVGADAVHNEITAQMTAALAFAPDTDTIFEIGGQDSKYIAIREGRLASFEMNKICAGGTGSFLEEQATRLGISVYGEFEEQAFQARQVCDLGSRCTVFMESEVVRARERGTALADICAGLAYSVARNYLEKVVAGRRVGRHVLFQGGSASNAALVAAFDRLLGRQVRVHPHNRISGAIGAALLAARAGSGKSRFKGLSSCASVSVRSFECQRCENRCQVNRVRVDQRVAYFGDVCERYSQRADERPTGLRSLPGLFAARNRLLDTMPGAPTGDAAGDRPRIGLLRASLNFEYLPFWRLLLQELGFEPVVSLPTTARMLQESGRGLPAEVCLPMKAAVAQARSLLDGRLVSRIFVPALVECPPRGRDDQSHTCFYAQQLPDMLRAHLGDRILSAQFGLAGGGIGLMEPVLALAEALDRPMLAVARALAKAQAAQQAYTAERRRLGEAMLSGSFDRAVVVLGRPYNTHDPFLNLALAGHIERLGLCAIPWDLLPLDDVELGARWQSVPWHFTREQLRAIEVMRRDARLFPIVVSSYGCGPDGFTVKHVDELLADRPRLLLEFDEHCGEAGLVTRLEAFADEIDSHLHERRRVATSARTTPGPRDLPVGQRFFVPHFGEHARIYAATLRAGGYAAEMLPRPGEATIRLGEAHASGQECHPYAILAGELLQFAREAAGRQDEVFLFPNCTAPCLLRQYGDSFRLLLDREGYARPEVWEATTAQLARILGMPGMIRLYEGLFVTDVLMTLATRLRPYERSCGTINDVLEASLTETERAVAERRRLDDVLAGAVERLCAVPRHADPGTRPIVGLTGDLYTRVNAAGNAALVQRLEAMGCEVWLSPFFSMMADAAYALDLPRRTERGLLKDAALDGLAMALGSGLRWRLLRRVPPRVVEWAVEPPVEDLISLARRYVGPRTNHLILTNAAKLADFLSRGASGAINAAALNCMVGTAVAAVVPAIRADFAQAPVLTLFYGGSEGPAQRIRLETFVHQVRARWRSAA